MSKPNPSLVVSSLALALPGIFFVQREEYIQASISFVCCFFSILWHSTKPKYNWILIADMIAANTTGLLAVHTAMRGSLVSLVPVSLFLGGGFILYYYGERNKCFLWCADYTVATRWHCLLHIGNGIMGSWLVLLINDGSKIKS